MADDSGDFMGTLLLWLAGIAFAVYMIYLFIVYVLPWVLLYLGSIGLPGWLLFRVLTSRRLRFTALGIAVLVTVVPACTWFVTRGFVHAWGLHPAHGVALGGAVLLVGALLTVATWVGCRWGAVYVPLVVAQRAEARILGRSKQLEAQAGKVAVSLEVIQGELKATAEQMPELNQETGAARAAASDSEEHQRGTPAGSAAAEAPENEKQGHLEGRYTAPRSARVSAEAEMLSSTASVLTTRSAALSRRAAVLRNQIGRTKAELDSARTRRASCHTQYQQFFAQPIRV